MRRQTSLRMLVDCSVCIYVCFVFLCLFMCVCAQAHEYIVKYPTVCVCVCVCKCVMRKHLCMARVNMGMRVVMELGRVNLGVS